MNNHVLVFGRRFAQNAFGKTLIAFVVIQIAFVVVSRVGYLSELDFVSQWVLPNGIERAQTVCFVVCVHLLVVVNTVVFMTQSLRYNKYLSQLDDRVQEDARKSFWVFVVSMFISVAISGGIILMFLEANVNGLTADQWKLKVETNEVACIALFGAFVIADCCCLRVCTISLAGGEALGYDACAKLRGLRDEVRLYLLACDGPGLCGIVLIAALSVLMQDVLVEYYWTGFVTGAIALHIVFSQSVLACLGAWLRS